MDPSGPRFSGGVFVFGDELVTSFLFLDRKETVLDRQDPAIQRHRSGLVPGLLDRTCGCRKNVIGIGANEPNRADHED